MFNGKIIAVDFDGCICANKWPEIGAANLSVINALLEERRNGTKLILWTCRHGIQLTQAVEWCAAAGLTFDAVNENLPEIIKDFDGDTRKVFAHEYWDDRAVWAAYR